MRPWMGIAAGAMLACESEVEALRAAGDLSDAGRAPCEARPLRAVLQGTATSGSGYPGEPAPLAAGGRVLYTKYQQGKADRDVFAYDPRTDTEVVLIDGGFEELLLDAAGSAVLVSQGGVGEGTLLYRDERASVELGPGGAPPLFFDYDGWRPRRVSASRAVWEYQGTMTLWADGRREAWSVGATAGADFEGDTVVWHASDGSDLEIYVKRSGDARPLRVTDNMTDDRAPLVSGETIFWLGDSALLAASLTAYGIVTLDEGPCLPPAGDSGRAIFACSDAPGWPMSARRLLLYESGIVRGLPLLRGGIVFSPRVHGDLAAWIEYDPGTDLCNHDLTEVGSIAVLDLTDLDAAPIEIARVGTACWCCDAYWPPPSVDLEDTTVAWNYALRPDGQPDPRGSFGYAVLEQNTCR